MAVIVLDVVIDDIETVIETFDQIKVFRSMTGETGPFTELTIPATRIPLVAGQASYKYTDLNGDADFYYYTTYFHSTTLVESSQSKPVPGAADPALDVISIEEFKTNYLFGLDLTNDAGEEYPDSLYRFYIRKGVSWVEEKLDIDLTPKQKFEEHDFIRQEYIKYVHLQTDRVPVISIDKLELILPTNQKVITYDPSWIQLQKTSGQIEIIPGGGQLSYVALGSGGAWPTLAYRWTDFIPGVFKINYTSGFAKGKVPPVITDLVGMVAALGPLNIAGDLLGGAGIASQSISLDGLSQSFNTTSSSTSAGFGARIIQYQKDIKDSINFLRKAYHPVSILVG